MRPTHLTLVLVLVLALVLVGCSKQDPEVSVNDQVPANQQVAQVEPGAEGEAAPAEGEGGGSAEADGVWTAENLEFTDSPETVPAGEVTIGLEIVGGLPHNVVFEGFQGDQPLVEGEGEGSYTGSADVPAGTYTYYCSVVGHRAAGMEGEVTVE